MPDDLFLFVMSIALISIILLFLAVRWLRIRNRQVSYIENYNKETAHKSVEEIVHSIMEEQHRIEDKITIGKEYYSKLREHLEHAEKQSLYIKVGLIPPTFNHLDSEKHKTAIHKCRRLQYKCVSVGNATTAYSDWTWFGSRTNGARMVEDYRFLMLKAFNMEFEAIRKQMRVTTGNIAIEKIDKLSEQMKKLGETANVEVSMTYVNLKVAELRVWHQDLVRKERLKQEKKAQQAKLRAQKKLGGDDADELDEEIAVCESELKKAQLIAEKIAGEERTRLERQIEKIKNEKLKLEQRLNRAISQAQLTKAGFVYVISNHGSFGQGVVKIGMTRRLEPMDRVNELGDASVPFKFDVHTLAFVENALMIEKALHDKFSEFRVNKDNFRKEFFRVDPDIVKGAMEELGVDSDWYIDVEAKEYQESKLLRDMIQTQNEKVTGHADLPENI